VSEGTGDASANLQHFFLTGENTSPKW
jgi:hypothetical protein